MLLLLLHAFLCVFAPLREALSVLTCIQRIAVRDRILKTLRKTICKFQLFRKFGLWPEKGGPSILALSGGRLKLFRV